MDVHTGDSVLQGMDMRIQMREEKEEERFRRLDETLYILFSFLVYPCLILPVKNLRLSTVTYLQYIRLPEKLT